MHQKDYADRKHQNERADEQAKPVLVINVQQPLQNRRACAADEMPLHIFMCSPLVKCDDFPINHRFIWQRVERNLQSLRRCMAWSSGGLTTSTGVSMKAGG